MNAPGPELLDIHLPGEPSWWPPAPGWWIVAALIIGLAVWLILWMRRRAQRRRWRLRILFELERFAADDQLKNNTPRLIAELSKLLRRASRTIRSDAATLRGKAWLDFLDSILATDEFSNGPGRVLLDGPFQRESTADSDALVDLVRRWLKRALDDQVLNV